jgi:carboxyl-terminal processing protease
VPDAVLRLGSVRDIISALDDPYTTYLGPQAYRLVRQETASTYGGIGLSVLPSARGFTVVALRDGPARRAGIRVGDTIVRIGGVPAVSLSMPHAIQSLVGSPGTSLELGLVRGSERFDVRVQRQRIAAPAVHARLVAYEGRKLGVLSVGSFRTGSTVLLRREIRTLARQGSEGLVLDLRGNPGGLLQQAVGVVSLFLDRGVVATVTGAHRPQEVLHAIPGTATTAPLVVLVDRYTASSSEIVAAALRDNHRATIVGQRTFGKALVQAFDPLGNGAALELTVARYRTPSGADLSGVGLPPQIRAVDRPGTKQDEALLMALQVLARPTS